MNPTVEQVVQWAHEERLYLDGENTEQPFWVLKTEELHRLVTRA